MVLVFKKIKNRYQVDVCMKNCQMNAKCHTQNAKVIASQICDFFVMQVTLQGTLWVAQAQTVIHYNIILKHDVWLYF